MKKVFLFIAATVLLFAGCQKQPEQMNAAKDGETVTVKVTAQLEDAALLSKASWDNDGNGAKVNHWILEVYDAQGALFDRQEKVNQTGLTNTFDVILIKNQTYELAFWADTKGAYKTEDLHAVAVNYTKVGLDNQDAFFADVDDYVSEMSETMKITLRRPLAQLNIVSLDLKRLYQQMIKAGTTSNYAKFCPVDLSLTGEFYSQFNVLDSLASEKKITSLELDRCYANYMAHKDTTTIFMCYGFAAPEKELYNLLFSFKSNEVPVYYKFDNIPLQRNYRTNIIGNLLSNDSKWDVVIDPVWETPEYFVVPVQSVTLDETEMTLFVGDTKTLEVTVLPEDATDPSVTWTSSDETVATVDEDGTVTAVDFGTAIITATSNASGITSASCTVTVDHEFVEIAGLKWAACNIGAADPKEAGWYFSWGNTEGYVLKNSKWVKASDETTPLGESGKFSEPNYNLTPGSALTGDIDPASGNDAARVNWSMDWRMPTSAEFQALYEACGGEGTQTTPAALTTATPEKGIYWLASDQEFIADYSGVAGILFVDESNTQLFFPVTGYGANYTSLQGTTTGRYWASTLNYPEPEMKRTAYKLYFTSSSIQSQYPTTQCYRGYAIRPVKDIEE